MEDWTAAEGRRYHGLADPQGGTRCHHDQRLLLLRCRRCGFSRRRWW
jgi:hypothetical protein